MVSYNKASCLRTKIQHEMSITGHSHAKISEKTRINPGLLSQMMNKYKNFTVEHLDQLAIIFNKPEGWLYEHYLDEECITEGKVSTPRIKPFILRCSDLGSTELILRAIIEMLEDPKSKKVLFEIGEELYLRKDWDHCIAIFKAVISRETNINSDLYLVSQYRIFRAHLASTDLQAKKDAIAMFIQYVDLLPTLAYQLDACLQLSNLFYTLQDWSNMEIYADKLRGLARTAYTCATSGFGDFDGTKTDRHLVVYYGQGFLLKSFSLQEQGKYVESKKYVEGYKNLSWFPYLNESNGLEEVEKFSGWALINSHELELLTGNFDILDDVYDFLKNNLPETMVGVTTIVRAANMHDANVDEVLEKVLELMKVKQVSIYPVAIDLRREQILYYELSVYYKRHLKYALAIENALLGISISFKIKDSDESLRFICLFEGIREFATQSQIKTFQKILGGT